MITIMCLIAWMLAGSAGIGLDGGEGADGRDPPGGDAAPREAATALVPQAAAPAVSETKVREAVGFLQRDLIPYARVEGSVLVPVMGRLLGSIESTRTLTLDRMEVGRMTMQLEQAAGRKDAPMIRRLLYGLYHVIRLHLAKQEQVYLPILDDRLTTAEAEELMD